MHTCMPVFSYKKVHFPVNVIKIHECECGGWILLTGTILLYIGIGLILCAGIGGLISMVVFRHYRKHLEETLRREYGERR